MLELRNVCKRYSSIPAVENVSFSARAGEVTGYLGPNGSGKSTTMKMITGLIEMSSGSILFQGRAIQDDLMAYKRKDDEARARVLDQLTAEAQELGMGY